MDRPSKRLADRMVREAPQRVKQLVPQISKHRDASPAKRTPAVHEIVVGRPELSSADLEIEDLSIASEGGGIGL